MSASSVLSVVQAVNTILFGVIQVNELLNIVSKMIQKKQSEGSKDFNDQEWQVIKELLSGANEKLKAELEKPSPTP